MAILSETRLWDMRLTPFQGVSYEMLYQGPPNIDVEAWIWLRQADNTPHPRLEAREHHFEAKHFVAQGLV